MISGGERSNRMEKLRRPGQAGADRRPENASCGWAVQTDYHNILGTCHLFLQLLHLLRRLCHLLPSTSPSPWLDALSPCDQLSLDFTSFLWLSVRKPTLPSGASLGCTLLPHTSDGLFFECLFPDTTCPSGTVFWRLNPSFKTPSTHRTSSSSSLGYIRSLYL